MGVSLNPYLVLNGNAREAVAFYEKALSAKLEGIMTFGEMGGDPNHPLPDGAKDLIMHAMLRVGETPLMFSDNYPGMPFQVGNNVNVTIVSDNADTSKQMFDALAEGGQVTMPMQETSWSPAYGQLTDKFGVVWQVNTMGKQ